ncbi:zinc metalloprotease HtpX [Ignicoccus hospitalis]|uniref:Protease HtpX homolog n=1 Tax=Ignicoccus hospitalis (strain KIN4/I / DSM 18386 / JCM 14125) TaxID=453591 RepID=A8AAM9_IGNH4|nr:zinc metalloprotease HtpX [Ignicoccus hospitalis]ABU81981.1 peptidase M48, Ste24p [Ignicoccus hospitalis KIN4/I]HIH89860.1 M48 family metalloprotease [Desulfurococcaceae archaeon]
MFLWGPSFFIEPLLTALVLALMVGLSPIINKVPKGERGLKLFMGLTLLAYVLLLYSGYSLIASTIGFNATLMGFALFVTAFAVIQWLIAPWLINIMYRTKPAEEVEPRLAEMVKALAAKAGFKKPPKALVADVNIPNAFAYGNFLTGKYVAVTRGMLNVATEEELEAVIGHELGHHRHGDVWLILALSLAPMLIYYLGRVLVDWGFFSGATSRDERNEGSALMFVGMALLAIGIALNFVLLQFNRLREYYADLHGAKVSGKRNMQRALARIHLAFESLKSDPALKEEVARFVDSPAKMLFIYAFAEPFYDIDDIVERLKAERTNPIVELFMSHPPIPKRLRFLDAI